MFLRIFVGLAVVFGLLGCSAAPMVAGKKGAAYDGEFWETWGDGYAEVSTYDLVIPRYGEPRAGESIQIWVSETFSERQRVKADPGKNPKADEFPVMKLHWSRAFQTGVYDYSETLSAFLGLAPSGGRPAGSLAKLSWSRQEWCGNMFQQALFDAAKVRVSGASYFDGEGDLAQTLEARAGGMSEDGLAFWARQMAGPYLQAGESKAVPFLTGMKSARDAHQAMVWVQINLTRGAVGQDLDVPAGTFAVEQWSAQLANGKGYFFWVEKAAPHRIVKWQFTNGEVAELIASERMKYWEMTRPGAEEALESLGMGVRAPRTLEE
jgi:hypothetical protein